GGREGGGGSAPRGRGRAGRLDRPGGPGGAARRSQVRADPGAGRRAATGGPVDPRHRIVPRHGVGSRRDRRVPRVDRRRIRRALREVIARLPLLFAFAFCAACIGAPLAAMLLETASGSDGCTLSAVGALLADPADRTQLLLSLALGGAATALALVLGGGHAWLTTGTDLPCARLLGPLGVAPLVVPPIFVAMGFADIADPTGFVGCACL